MNSQMIRLYLLLSWGLLLMLGLLSWGMKEPDRAAAYSPPNAGEARPNAFVHQWDVNEIFSCGDGSEQFVELLNPTSDNFEVAFAGQQLIAANLNATQTHTFTFPSNVSPPTGNKSLLIATNGFSSLPGGVTPDFILPDDFLFPGGGSVKFGTFDTFSYGAGQLPLDGVNSLRRQGASLVTGLNSPQNYTDPPGSVSCPAPPDLTLSKTADAAGIVEAGGVLSYTITVINSGNLTATNALITDVVPLSTTYIPNSASNGGIFGSGIISWPNLTINSGASLTRTFEVTVGATITTGDKITNTAFITSAEGVSATDSVIVTGGSDPNQKIYLPLIFKNS
jgi:uncharacterized repeat protein (TIGR01451 family)